MRVRSVVTNASCLACDTMSVEQDFTAIIMIQSGYGTEKCRFPRAVPANKGSQLSSFERGIDLIEKPLLCVAYGKIAQFYHTVIDLLRKTTHTTIGIPSSAVMAFTGKVNILETISQRSNTAAPERRVPGRSTRWSASRKSIRAT